MRRGFAPIIIIAIVAAFIIGIGATAGYFKKLKSKPTAPAQQAQASPQTSPQSTPDASREPNGSAKTANWNTYRNEEHGFELKYPPDWNAHRDKAYLLIDSLDYSGQGIISSILEQVNSGTRIVITRYENIKTQSLKQLSSDYPTQFTKKEIVVDGQSGLSIDTVIEGGIYETVVFLFKDNFLYQIHRAYPKDQKSQYEKAFNQILSTFKFLD